jgi:hypothetical protein
MYEATCTLRMLMDALLTIRPTSTQNERNLFSVWDICHETKLKIIGQGN